MNLDSVPRIIFCQLRQHHHRMQRIRFVYLCHSSFVVPTGFYTKLLLFYFFVCEESYYYGNKDELVTFVERHFF
jgi:hypothetical protein